MQAYLNDELAAKLNTWMKAPNIDLFSQAVVVILEHYLSDRPPSTISCQVPFDEVESLKPEKIDPHRAKKLLGIWDCSYFAILTNLD